MKKPKAKAKVGISRRERETGDKFGERRAELAQAALQTLSERGYARTSLREIAQNTEFSLGVIHYYFADKVELITFCVRQYKATCVKRYDDIVASSKTAAGLRKGFAAGMAETLKADASMHRLWYDLRTQSLFEQAFAKDVRDIDASLERMIWRIVSEYGVLAKKKLRFSSSLTYALFDGIFQQALVRHVHGDARAARALVRDIETLLGEMTI